MYKRQFCDKFNEEWFQEYPTYTFIGHINSAAATFIFTMVGIFSLFWSCFVYTYLTNDTFSEFGDQKLLIIWWIFRDVLISLLCMILIDMHCRYHLTLELKERYSWIHPQRIERSMRKVIYHNRSHERSNGDVCLAFGIIYKAMFYDTLKLILEQNVDQQWLIQIILSYIEDGNIDSEMIDQIQHAREGMQVQIDPYVDDKPESIKEVNQIWQDAAQEYQDFACAPLLLDLVTCT